MTSDTSGGLCKPHAVKKALCGLTSGMTGRDWVAIGFSMNGVRHRANVLGTAHADRRFHVSQK